MLKSAAKKSFKWSLLIQLSNQSLNFLLTIILARILSPADFGIIGLTTIFINIAKKVTDGGLASSLIRTEEVDDRDFSTVFYFNLVCSLFFYSLLFVSAPFIAKYFETPIIKDLVRVSGLAVIFSAFTITQSVKLNKELNFKKQFQIQLPSIAISSFVAITAAYYGMGVWSLVLRELVFILTAGIQLWFYSNWTPLLIFDKNSFKKHFGFGYKLVITDLISQVFNDSYKAIIGKTFSTSQLGFFTRAKSLEELPSSLVFNSINRVMFPILAQVQDDHQRLKNVYSEIIKAVTFLITPFLMLLYIIAEPLFNFLFTEKWLPAVPYFKILIIAGMIAPLQPYLLNICKVKGRSDLVLKLSVIEYILVGLSMLAMIPFGIYGLLWGIVVATIVKLLFAMYIAGNLIGYSVSEQMIDLREGFILSGIGFILTKILISTELLCGISSIGLIVALTSYYYLMVIFFSWLLGFNSITIVKSLFKRR